MYVCDHFSSSFGISLLQSIVERNVPVSGCKLILISNGSSKLVKECSIMEDLSAEEIVMLVEWCSGSDCIAETRLSFQ